jgi:hypothetical protein
VREVFWGGVLRVCVKTDAIGTGTQSRASED